MLFLLSRLVIEQNRHKYSVSAMCKVLKIALAPSIMTRKYPLKRKKRSRRKSKYLKEIDNIFNKNRQAYETRKLNRELNKENKDIPISRRRIERLMGELGIQSKYTRASYKPMTIRWNEEPVKTC